MEAPLVELELKEYVGKKVVLVKKLDEPNEQGHMSVEEEGTLEEANPTVGIFFRPKGHSFGGLVKMSAIDDIRLVPITAKPIKVKGLKKMTLDTVRQHLADRHGVSVKKLNETSEQAAMDLHDSLHAEAKGDLGHEHGDVGFIES